jgi:hypothetical protein
MSVMLETNISSSNPCHKTAVFTGNESELIIFPSALSTSDRQKLEHDQESYYSITGI